MNVTRIAIRNVARQKKRSILLGGAIAFGVMIITLIGSFSRGIADTATSSFDDLLGGQLYITGTELTDTGGQVSVVRDREVLIDALERLEEPIVDQTYRSRTIGEVIFGSKRSQISIEGVDWESEPSLIETIALRSGQISSDMPPEALVLPQYIADDVGVEIGENVLIRTSTVTGQQNVGEFEVTAISAADSMFSFTFAYASRAYVNSLIGLESDQYQVLNIGLQKPTAAGAATEKILEYFWSIGRAEAASPEETGVDGMMSRMQSMASLMGGGAYFSSRVDEDERWEGTRFTVLNIDDMMVTVTNMVSVLNTVSYVIFAVLMLITMVGLLNTFRMVLIERTEEIGTMRAIGMQRSDVRNIFLSEALVLAVGGALIGLVVALLLSAVISIIPFSADSPLQLFLADNRFAFPIVPSNIISTLIIIILGALGSAYMPARRAARLDPAVALRTTY